jgi:hypothetical protein
MLYHNLLPVVLSRVERLAQTDAKYAERCRLENYCFMGEALKSLADRLPALQQHWQVGWDLCRAFDMTAWLMPILWTLCIACMSSGRRGVQLNTHSLPICMECLFL